MKKMELQLGISTNLAALCTVLKILRSMLSKEEIPMKPKECIHLWLHASIVMSNVVRNVGAVDVGYVIPASTWSSRSKIRMATSSITLQKNITVVQMNAVQWQISTILNSLPKTMMKMLYSWLPPFS